MDIVTYILSKKYTDKSLIGGGAIKGKNCTIDSITTIDGGHRVTFNWTLDDGTEETGYMDVMDGSCEEIVSVVIDNNNHFIVTYSDGTTHDCGAINVANERELTKAQYDALSNAEKMNGTTYYVTDEDGDDAPVVDVVVNGQSVVDENGVARIVIASQIQSDWNQEDNAQKDFIKNRTKTKAAGYLDTTILCNELSSGESYSHNAGSSYKCVLEGTRNSLLDDGNSHSDCSHAEGNSNVGYAVSNSHLEGYNNRLGDIENHTHPVDSHIEGGSNVILKGTAQHAEGYSNSITDGYYSHAEGARNTVSGPYSHAEGQSNTVSGGSAHAEGYGNTASGNGSHTEGDNNRSTGSDTHTEGVSNLASGRSAHAEGEQNTAEGIVAHAEGSNNRALGSYSHVEGTGTEAHILCHAEGNGTVAGTPAGDGVSGHSCAHAEGGGTQATGNNSHAEGYGGVASGEASHAEGFNSTASGQRSHAEGDGSAARSHAAHAEGFVAIASGQYSHAEGGQTTASGNGAHSEGAATTASGRGSHAGGMNSTASANESFAHGYIVTASNKQSTAFGLSNYEKLRIDNSDNTYTVFSIGNGTVKEDPEHPGTYIKDVPSNAFEVRMNGTVIEGSGCGANGAAAHAEGNGTHANGSYSHTEGNGTTASADDAHSEGAWCTASGVVSHAEGDASQARGYAAHAEGKEAVAVGAESHAGGYKTNVNGQRAFTHGYLTTATNNDEVVFGVANSEVLSTTDPTAYTVFAIGNGTVVDDAATARSNVFEVRSNGAVLANNSKLISVSELQTIVASCTDFSDFKTAIAAL